MTKGENGDGGDIKFDAGDGAGANGGNGGNVEFYGGNGDTGNGGSIDIIAGEGKVGNGGGLIIQSGKGSSLGGNMLLKPGESSNGNGALFEIKGGKGSATGGSVEISTGDWGSNPGRFKFIDGKNSNSMIMSELYRLQEAEETRLKYNYMTRYMLKPSATKSLSIGEGAYSSSSGTYLTFDTDNRKLIVGDSTDYGLVDTLDIDLHNIDATSQVTTIHVANNEVDALIFDDPTFPTTQVDYTLERGAREGSKKIY